MNNIEKLENLKNVYFSDKRNIPEDTFSIFLSLIISIVGLILLANYSDFPNTLSVLIFVMYLVFSFALAYVCFKNCFYFLKKRNFVKNNSIDYDKDIFSILKDIKPEDLLEFTKKRKTSNEHRIFYNLFLKHKLKEYAQKDSCFVKTEYGEQFMIKQKTKEVEDVFETE